MISDFILGPRLSSDKLGHILEPGSCLLGGAIVVYSMFLVPNAIVYSHKFITLIVCPRIHSTIVNSDFIVTGKCSGTLGIMFHTSDLCKYSHHA